MKNLINLCVVYKDLGVSNVKEKSTIGIAMSPCPRENVCVCANQLNGTAC